MFLSVALVVVATFAFLHLSPKIATASWIVAGFLAGVVQLSDPMLVSLQLLWALR